jgi:SAM-dependent methyltransferase
MNDYIFKDHQTDLELRRLQRIEHALDPRTCRILVTTGISPKWRCLEVGAGSGSIMQWLGARVGSDGQVVGVDKQIKYLGHLSKPPYRIFESDALKFSDSEGFDLIHARYVLIHNRNSTDILAHLKGLLRPGGHLVLEEPDFEAAEWIDSEYRCAGQRVNKAIVAMFSSLSLDPGFGSRLPLAISRQGLVVRLVEAISHLEPGSGPVAMVMADSAAALRDKYIATGEATDGDITQYIRGARDPSSWATYYSTISVVACHG